MTKPQSNSIAVLTSGGDAPGMNAAVRAVVRSALYRGIDVYAIYEGYRGMVAGGECIRKLDWDAVGGIMQQGGTVIGTARCKEFMTREGRRRAALNLLICGINRLVVIGGDGSLTGANLFRSEWPELIEELVASHEISPELASEFPHLYMVGLVGSIDNDMFGTDMTIGADTALHRITEAIDAIQSTAASHQRTFVIEVMGRRCGYLALMSAIATGANWVLIPEYPPDSDTWEAEMCQALKAGRDVGRRHGIVVVAEGAQDASGKPITSAYVKDVIEKHSGEEARITILGHVQRGGAPSAFERYMSTVVGHDAVDALLAATPKSEPELIGLHEHKVVRSPLMDCVAKTRQVAQLLGEHNYTAAMRLRGGSFVEAFAHFRTLVRTRPCLAQPGQRQLRIAVMHCGGPAPGMNTAVRAAVRLTLDKGHAMLAVRNGIRGLVEGELAAMEWMSVSGWVGKGGAELGTSRRVPAGADFYAIARTIEAHKIDALLMIGGWAAYETAHLLAGRRDEFPAFEIPIVCLPASIDNNLPGSEHSIGADTALNSIVANVDKIKQSAVASRRCFVVEVMGRDCGYLALVSGLATGAERVYMPEEGVTLAALQEDVTRLTSEFRRDKRLGLIIRNENTDPWYTTDFICALLEKEGGDLFDVRKAILGHVQQGGNPTPYDRIQATRLAARCIEFLTGEGVGSSAVVAIGLQDGHVQFTNLLDFPRLVERNAQRPKQQWWLRLQPIIHVINNRP